MGKIIGAQPDDLMKLPDLSSFPFFATDTETNGLIYRKNKPFSFSISVPGGFGVGPSGPEDYYFDQRLFPKCWMWLQDQLRKAAERKSKAVFHNGPFDVMMLDEVGVKVPLSMVEDTQLLACLINEHEFSYKLDDLAWKYLKDRKEKEVYDELAAMFGGAATRNVQMPNLHKAPPATSAPYAMKDTNLTLRLWLKQRELIEQQDLHQIVAFERNCQPHFIRAMLRGVRVDVPRAQAAKERLEKLSSKMREDLYRLVGFECNTNPSGDMLKIFKPYERRIDDDTVKWYTQSEGVEIGLESTPGGKPSFNADALRLIKHPAAAMILQIRKYDKLSSTFIGGHILSNQVNGRVYPQINQGKGESERKGGMEGTGTGRLSYTGPALQQITKRDKELCAIIRDLFIADEGHKWSSRDWSQTDFRFMAHYTKAPMILKAYNDDPYTDFHSIVANLTGIKRDADGSGGGNAKQINLGLMFGMGEGKLASEMELPFTWTTIEIRDKVTRKTKKITYRLAGPEAKEVFTKYHSLIPEIQLFLDRAKKVAEARGYLKSMFGRHLRFPLGSNTRKAGGLIFQAATADLLKDRFAKVSEYLDTVGGYVILSVHDELNNSIPDGDPAIDREIRTIMEESSMYNIPLRSSGGMGNTWWQAMQAEKEGKKK